MASIGSPDAGSIHSILDDKLPIIVNKMLTVYYGQIDPFFEGVASSERVSSDGLGRNFQVRKLFQTSVAGNIVMDSGPFPTLYGDGVVDAKDGSFYIQGTSAASEYPNPNLGANAVQYEMVVPLRSMRASLDLTIPELRAEALPEWIGEMLRPKIVGFVNHLTRLRAFQFYTTDSDYAICTFTGSQTNWTSTTHEVTLTPANAAVHRFHRGMRVDLYDGASQITKTGHEIYVKNVDEIDGTIVLVSVKTDGTASPGDDFDTYTNAPTSATTISCFWADSKSQGFAGLNTWIKNSGSIFSVNVDQQPVHKSLIKAETGALTEQKLRRYVTRFNSAKNQYGMSIDTFVTTPGVYNAYIANKLSLQQYERAGRTFDQNNEGSAPGMTFVYDGRTYTFRFSDWCDSGTMYGVKTSGNNYTRYVPPSAPTPGREGSIPQFMEFEFVAPYLTGQGSIRLPYWGANRLPTNQIQMPGDSRMEIVPDQLPGIKITGLSEDKIYGD